MVNRIRRGIAASALVIAAPFALAQTQAQPTIKIGVLTIDSGPFATYALTSLSVYLAEEVKPHNVAVNVIFPGATRTTGSDELTPGREALGLRMELLDARICCRSA